MKDKRAQTTYRFRCFNINVEMTTCNIFARCSISTFQGFHSPFQGFHSPFPGPRQAGGPVFQRDAHLEADPAVLFRYRSGRDLGRHEERRRGGDDLGGARKLHRTSRLKPLQL